MKSNDMKQTNISQFFVPKQTKPIIEEGFDSFFDDIPTEELEPDLNSIPITSQPISPSSQQSSTANTSSSATSSQAPNGGPTTPSKLKLPISFTSKSNTPNKPLPLKSSFSIVINDEEIHDDNKMNDIPKPQQKQNLFKKNIDSDSNSGSNDPFYRFKEEKPKTTTNISTPSRDFNNNNTTTTSNISKKRKEMDFDEDGDESNANNNKNNNNNNNKNINNVEDLDEFSFVNKYKQPSNSFPTTTTTNATPKTPTKTTKRRPIITYDDDDDENDDDDDDDNDDSNKSKSSTKKKGNPFGRKDKKEIEERYSFLVNIRDANGNPKDHPDYDKRTLHIPASCLSKFSPFERQFWDIKSKNYDTVVFFKKGKFYELYESDADIGHQQLHLKMTDRVNMRMVGVPEMSFNHWASKLIHLGHKVAKVDQMETSIGMAKRQNEKGGRNKKDSIIQRELTSILTAGTLLDEQMITDQTSTYLMAIKENEYDKQYGVCFVDVSIGEFYLCTIQDDDNRMQFETLLLQMMPKEIVYEKGATSPKTMSIMKRVLSTVKPLMNARLSLEYWDPVDTLERVTQLCGGKTPESLSEMKNEEYLVGALGGCISYLMDIRIGNTVVEQGRFKRFNPLDVGNSMILDGQCLVNLEIFNNSTDGSTEGTLFKLMDRCTTAFGKRMFRQWICRPLANKGPIVDRQKAIDFLRDNPETLQKVMVLLNKLPDLERMIARIRAKTSKISDLISVLNHFENIHAKLLELSEEVEQIESIHLRNCLFMDISQQSHINGCQDDEQQNGNAHYSGYPNLKPYIERVRKSFTIEQDRVVPSKGLFLEFDQCLENIQSLEHSFAKHLEEQKAYFKCNKIEYKHMGKEIYQIEIPVAFTKKLPAGFSLKSSSSKVNRYHSPFVSKNLSSLLEERDTYEVLSKEVLKKIQSNFAIYFNHFQTAISRLSQLDCLLSLYKVSFQSSIQMCRPLFVSDNTGDQRGFIDVKDMRHPCIYSKSGDDFIPNDISLNTENNPPSLMVLTGPNMGGKSTLLRQTCILVIMAQMGCYVSATSCEMSIVDRIFTRLGANDNILAGQSTFMVELAETCAVLKYATKRSLVILDELGRGTSTFDGYSIAYSVLNYLVTKVQSMCVFATHYQSLAYEPTVRDLISTAYMTCHVDEEAKKVIFLYKLASGVCPNSYGLHVASMAGLPREIILKAEEKSTQMEKDSVLVSFIHGTIHRSKLVEKIIQSFKQKDLNQLIQLSNTLKDLNLNK
ncbi:hypothetical protein RB653_007944 [Dictyostelium firmibasis]|uniref:DNA mismatch repair protein n=1 Tax=Dictyostelium firmibasis TaxID=79012 RepID=A0AAN7YY82_9MYCE